MDKQTALLQLRDIHEPALVGWWPIAPGWAMLFLATIVLGGGWFFIGQYYLANRKIKRYALQLLALYQQQYALEHNASAVTSLLSTLLKRVALQYFPRHDVASLHGQTWIAFLNQTSKGLDFNPVQEALLIWPWQARVDPSPDLSLLFSLSKAWIKQRRKPCLN